MRDLTQGPIAGHLLGMAAFIGISLIFQTMYFIVDLYFVSRLGSAVIAGVSASGNVFFLALAASQLISIGVMATVAQVAGKKGEGEAHLLSGQAHLMLLLFGAVMLVLGYAFGRTGVDALTAHAASAAHASEGRRRAPVRGGRPRDGSRWTNRIESKHAPSHLPP